MGCDIHFYVEKKINNKWQCIDNILPNIDFDENDEHCLDFYIESIYTNRNYFLFGILAGVRSYCEEPISEPKGLPDDVSDIIKELSNNYGVDGHSHSWLTLKEILDYDWDSVEKVCFEEYEYNYINDFKHVIKKLISCSIDVSLLDIRCVFWFDS